MELNALRSASLMSQLSLFDSSSPLLHLKRAPDAFGHELSPEQAAVRDAGSGHRVVVAGAGTGKTELLTQRVLKLLLEGAGEGTSPANLEGVVALTFTNKAAAEMRARVYRALVRRLRSTSDADERTRLSVLRAEFSSRNRIWTFDSLASTILHLFPEHSPLPRGAALPTAGESRALARTLGRQFWNWVGLGDEAQAQSLFEFLEPFERRESALLAIREAARREESDLERLCILPCFPQFAGELLCSEEQRLDKLWAAHQSEAEALENLPSSARNALLDSAIVKLPLKEGGILTQSAFSAPFKKQLGEVVSSDAQGVWSERLLEWRAGIEDLESRRHALELCIHDPSLDSHWEREWRGRRLVALLAGYARWWKASERSLKNERQLADFEDWARAALFVLEETEAGALLRSETQWLLVDEFQDTNPAQWRVVEALRKRAPELGNALLVGDPKQAIYDFRGGDIRVFDAGRQTLEREGAISSALSLSRRSAPPVVEWTNRCFASIFPSEGAPRESYEAAHGPLSPVFEAWETPRAIGDVPGVYALKPLAWRDKLPLNVPLKTNIESYRIEAAHALASWLLEVLHDARSELPNSLRQPAFASVSKAIGEGKPAIALLFARNAVKGLFETVLRARGVPFTSVGGKGFFRCDAVRWSVSLWRALLDGNDEAARVGLLRSPLGGQSDVSLLERHASKELPNETWAPSDAFDAATYEALRLRLANWRTLSGVLPVSQVMERVLEESELAWFEASCLDAPQRRENWAKLLDIVREREAENEGGLRALVDHFEAHADDDSEPLAPLPGGDSIQLMTIHGSKGLGFPCVVLAQLEATNNDKSDGTVLWGESNGQPTAAFGFSREREDAAQTKEKIAPPLAYAALKREASARAEAEWKRLFYVACTRAQSHLVLLETEGNTPKGSWGAMSAVARIGLEEVRPTIRPDADANGEPPLREETLPLIEPKSRLLPSLEDLRAQPPAPLIPEQAREKRFDELWGAPADLPVATERAWVERLLRDFEGDAATLRQDVPFCARGALLGAPCEWVVGAWPWLAALPDGSFLLATTGERPATARERAERLGQIAREAGLRVSACYAGWTDEGNSVRDMRVEA